MRVPSRAEILGATADKQGVASALNDTVRELGGAIGVALLGSVLNGGYRANMASTAEALPPALRGPVEDGIGSALAVSSQLGADGAQVADAARHAFVDGWQSSMWVGVAMAAVAVLFIAWRAPRRSDATEIGTIGNVDAVDVDVLLEPIAAGH